MVIEGMTVMRSIRACLRYKTIVYTTTGDPLSRENYQQDLDEAIAQANRGEVITQLGIEQNQP